VVAELVPVEERTGDSRFLDSLGMESQKSNAKGKRKCRSRSLRNDKQKSKSGLLRG
jgi:hypothetical protein